MMDDYLAGLKPAKIIAVAKLLGTQIFQQSREQLKLTCNTTPIPPWLYDACKAVQHGSNYGMGKNTMSTNILKQGWKKSGEVTYVSPKDCEELQRLYFARYIGIKMWHAWVKQVLERDKKMSCCSGHTRQFFGRPNDLETFKSALSHEPQANTTYATNLAVHNLWHDESNWNSQGLIIQPLHQVHDAVCGQFLESDLRDSAAKIHSYFRNTLTIAGMDLVIPFEGKYGPNWNEKEQQEL